MRETLRMTNSWKKTTQGITKVQLSKAWSLPKAEMQTYKSISDNTVDKHQKGKESSGARKSKVNQLYGQDVEDFYARRKTGNLGGFSFLKFIPLQHQLRNVSICTSCSQKQGWHICIYANLTFGKLSRTSISLSLSVCLLVFFVCLPIALRRVD